MVTISGSKSRVRYASSHFHYAVTNIIITLVVMMFLNIYSTGTNQAMIYRNKESAMLSKGKITATEIATLNVLNAYTVSKAIGQMGSLDVDRMIVTDQSGIIIYDTDPFSSVGDYALLPEIISALNTEEHPYGNDVFTWHYKQDGSMHSHVATPIVSYGTVIGCVYIMEHDNDQGQLIRDLQQNMLTITGLLVLGVICFSILFSNLYSSRLRRILASMRIIREGDYSQTVDMGGHDELTFLGREFNDLTERLQISENKRRQFISDASHELKTPLASIKLLSDSILQNDMDIVTIREFVSDIGNEADRLNRMSEKLLSLSRIESQQDGTCEIVKLAPTIERVVRMLSGIAAKSNITIEQDLEGDCPILILEDDLYQIAFNLAENGIKYNTPGGKLYISVFRQEDNAILQIRDTGAGIPADAIPHLFERFYRVDKARSRKTGGSGLGLAIVRNLVERNGGTIGVESTPGEGSIFQVSFPIFDTEEQEVDAE